MKSTGRNVGNLNMKGKKHIQLSCRCCDAYDLREKYNEKFETLYPNVDDDRDEFYIKWVEHQYNMNNSVQESYYETDTFNYELMDWEQWKAKQK